MRNIEIVTRPFDLTDKRARSKAGLYPRQHLLSARGLAQKIIGAARQPFCDLIGSIVRRHEKDVARLEFGVRPYRFTDAGPIHSRHHPIQDDEVGPVGARGG